MEGVIAARFKQLFVLSPCLLTSRGPKDAARGRQVCLKSAHPIRCRAQSEGNGSTRKTIKLKRPRSSKPESMTITSEKAFDRALSLCGAEGGVLRDTKGNLVFDVEQLIEGEVYVGVPPATPAKPSVKDVTLVLQSEGNGSTRKTIKLKRPNSSEPKSMTITSKEDFSRALSVCGAQGGVLEDTKGEFVSNVEQLIEGEVYVGVPPPKPSVKEVTLVLLEADGAEEDRTIFTTLTQSVLANYLNGSRSKGLRILGTKDPRLTSLVEELSSGKTYEAVRRTSVSLEDRVKKMENFSINESRAMEEAVTQFLHKLAMTEYRASTVSVIDNKEYKLKEVSIVEVDAAIRVVCNDGLVVVLICECKKRLHKKDCLSINAKWNSILNYKEQIQELGADYRGLDKVRKFVAGDSTVDRNEVLEFAELLGVEVILRSGNDYGLVKRLL